jgi:hypothetical protein
MKGPVFAINAHDFHLIMLATTIMLGGEIRFSFFESRETHKYTLGTKREV